MSTQATDLVNRYSKYTKTVRNRIVEVEFKWFQTNPHQYFQLRINEEQFLEAQQHIRSKKMIEIPFEQFILLIDPILNNDVAEINPSILRWTFDSLFDQNTNGNVEKDEFESLFILLHGWIENKKYLNDENLRHFYPTRSNYISFQEFSTFVKHGYLRELLMMN